MRHGLKATYCERLKSGSHYRGKYEARERTEVTSGEIDISCAA
jgi:hypothetical protein